MQHLLQAVKDLDAAPQGVAEPLKAQRHDHELLQIDRVIGVRPAVDDVHHRRRQQVRPDAAQIAIQRLLAEVGRRLGHGQRHAEDRVGAQVLLVRRAVELDQPLVDADLIERVPAGQRIGDRRVDVLNGLGHALAQIDALVAVAQLPGLVNARARPAGHGGPAERAVGKRHFDFDGRIAAAIENLASVDGGDEAHGRVGTEVEVKGRILTKWEETD